MLRQRTLRDRVSCSGVALHSGRTIHMELYPAPENNGVTFVRTDLGVHAELKASIEHLADTRLATTLAAGVNGSRASVGTIEHLLAALMGLGIDNVRVHLDGPEVPVMDGSAAPLVNLLLAAGIQPQKALKRFLVMKREVKVTDGDKVARLSPGPGFRVNCALDFDHPLIPPTPFEIDVSERTFVRELAPARTFGFLKEVEMLRAAGLALGGSLDNAVVIDDYRVLNPEGLRFPDEFVRHKVLDAIGDLALFGMPVVGKLHLSRSGHALNTRLVQAVLADDKAYDIVVPGAEAGRLDDAEPLGVLSSLESLA